jgi:hypothetical protein
MAGDLGIYPTHMRMSCSATLPSVRSCPTHSENALALRHQRRSCSTLPPALNASVQGTRWICAVPVDESLCRLRSGTPSHIHVHATSFKSSTDARPRQIFTPALAAMLLPKSDNVAAVFKRRLHRRPAGCPTVDHKRHSPGDRSPSSSPIPFICLRQHCAASDACTSCAGGTRCRFHH